MCHVLQVLLATSCAKFWFSWTGKGNVVASTTKQETLHARLEACRQRKQLAKQEKKENRNKTMSLLQKVLDGDKLDGELFGEILRKRSDTYVSEVGCDEHILSCHSNVLVPS